ncbi:MAG: zinc ribbon domain-containing protein [Terriglobales bacterium]|jgi:putative FmdB family regulatory protein
MPLYEYQCKKCKHRFEKIQKFSDKPITKCPECGGPVEKLISASAVQFKGSGWYVSDYGRKGSSGQASSAYESDKAKSEGDSSKKDSKDSKESSKDAKETKETKKEEKPKAETTSKKAKKD